MSLDIGDLRRNLSRSRSKAPCQSLLVPLCKIKLLTDRLLRKGCCSRDPAVACELLEFTECAEGRVATFQDLIELTRGSLPPLAWGRMTRQTRQLLLCLTVLVQQQVWQLPAQLQQTLSSLLLSTPLTKLPYCRHGYAFAVGHFTRLLLCSFSNAIHS